VRESDPSLPHISWLSKLRSASEILASRRSRTHNTCSISSARGTSARLSTTPARAATPSPPISPIVHMFDQLAAKFLTFLCPHPALVVKWASRRSTGPALSVHPCGKGAPLGEGVTYPRAGECSRRSGPNRTRC
jgi:hypothetical protein